MGDLVRIERRRGPSRALTAAAKILAPTREDEPSPEAWASTAWGYRNTVGEVRYSEMWLGSTMGQAKLVAATRTAPGDDPVPLPETHPASEYMSLLAGGVGGQAALLRAFGTYLLTPGVGYLVGTNPKANGGPTWQVRDAEEVRISRTSRTLEGGPIYEVACGDQRTDWESIGPDGLVVRVWRPDPQRYWRPDSPVRGAFPILKELVLLTQSIEATATSRLAGAGLLPLPREMTFPDGGTFEKFVTDLINAVTKPIKDRGSAAAYVPFPFQVPGEFIDKLKRIEMFSLFDEHALKLREELIQRLGTAMDVPMQVITGVTENHWGKALTAEEGRQLHTEPNLELVCDAITRGYLQPALMRDATLSGLAEVPPEGRLLAEATQGMDVTDGDGNEIVAWYVLPETIGKDKSEDAKDAYDRFEASGDLLRSELGLTDEDVPEQAEVERRIWISLAQGTDPTLAGVALKKLGMLDEADLPPAPAPPGPPGGPPGGPPPAGPENPVAPGGEPTPRTKPTAPPPPEPAPAPTPQPKAADTLALTAACDGLVHRALEKSGNRLRQATARQRAADPGLDQPAILMHTRINAAAVRPLAALLDGAWDRVPEVADRLGVDPDWLCRTLDGYTVTLIRSRTPHSWDVLSARIEASLDAYRENGVDAVVNRAEQVLATIGRAS